MMNDSNNISNNIYFTILTFCYMIFSASYVQCHPGIIPFLTQF